MTIFALILLVSILTNFYANAGSTGDDIANAQDNILATAVAQSWAQTAQGLAFDNVTDTSDVAFQNPSVLTAGNALGVEPGENKDSVSTYNDFDDFNNLKLCYHSDLPGDSDATPGYIQIKVPGIRAKYYVTCIVQYVNPPNLDAPYTIRQTWHKKLTVTVTSPSATGITGKPDTLVYPAIMSYWN